MQAHTIGIKIAAVEFAAAIGKGGARAAQVKFHVCSSLFYLWQKNYVAGKYLLYLTNCRKKRTFRLKGAVRKLAMTPRAQWHMMRYLDMMCDNDHRVTMGMLAAQYKLVEPLGLSKTVLHRRICALFKAHIVTIRRVTHVAQNTKHNEEVVTSWKAYIHDRIRMYNIGVNDVCNSHSRYQINHILLLCPYHYLIVGIVWYLAYCSFDCLQEDQAKCRLRHFYVFSVLTQCHINISQASRFLLDLCSITFSAIMRRTPWLFCTLEAMAYAVLKSLKKSEKNLRWLN
jgi:hypothetical protein